MVAVTTLVGLGLTFLASGVIFYSHETQLEQIKSSFKQKIHFNYPNCFMESSTIIRNIKEKLKTQHTNGMYYLLEAPHGCGKTTALLSAAKAIGNNIVYVGVNPHKEFGISFANALSIDLGCKESPSGVILVKKECPRTPEGRLKSCLNVLEAALKQMQKEGNPAPILIIDDVNFLLEQGGLIFMLQEFAEKMAEKHLLTIYFVSEGQMYNHFHQQPAAAGMITFPHEKYELSNEEAMSFLHCQCPRVFKDTITEIVDIVGGQFRHLVQIIDMLHDPAITLPDIKKHLFYINVITKLKALPTSKTGHSLTDVAWSLAKKLLVAPKNLIRFGDDLWRNLSDDEKNALATAYIFDVDWIRQKITFQTTLVHSYFKEIIEREEMDSQGVCTTEQETGED